MTSALCQSTALTASILNKTQQSSRVRSWTPSEIRWCQSTLLSLGHLLVRTDVIPGTSFPTRSASVCLSCNAILTVRLALGHIPSMAAHAFRTRTTIDYTATTSTINALQLLILCVVMVVLTAAPGPFISTTSKIDVKGCSYPYDYLNSSHAVTGENSKLDKI